MLGVLRRGSRSAGGGPWSRVTVSAVIVVMIGTGCSSSGKVASGQSSPPVNPTSSASATATSSVQPSGTANAPSSGPSSSTGTSAPSPTATASRSATPSASPPKLPITATLAHACVQPGHSQSLHVHSMPKVPVIYDSFYSDGRDGGVYGGRGTNEQTDENGNYDATWTILPTAPLGKVRVDVAAAGKVGGRPATGSTEVTFVLKTIC